jgi:hypothetical protein
MKPLTRFLKQAIVIVSVVIITTLTISAKLTNRTSAKSILPSKPQYKNSAVGFTDTKGNSAVPKVTITDGHIKSVWSIQGCGNIKHTWLTGTGGNYYLPQGDANITPGTYSLQIDGNITQTSTGPCSVYGKVQITLSYN